MSVALQFAVSGSLSEFLAVVLVTVGVFAAVFGLGAVFDRFF
ncbi:hypothetical protein [Halomicrobium salinisoli]|nr:hypothetical protein [Halomicrobium salinisoli]